MPRPEETIVIYNSTRAGNPLECIWPNSPGTPVYLQAYVQYHVVDSRIVLPFYVQTPVEVRGVAEYPADRRWVIEGPRGERAPMHMGTVHDTQHPENPAIRVAPGTRPPQTGFTSPGFVPSDRIEVSNAEFEFGRIFRTENNWVSR